MKKPVGKCIIMTLFLCLFFVCGVQIQAFDDLDMIIPMEDAAGRYLPRAKTVNPMLYSSYLSDFSYEEQLENEMQITIYKKLESVSNWMTYSSDNKFILTLPYTVTFQGKVTTSNYMNDPAYNRAIRDFAKASHAYIKDHTGQYWISSFKLSITSDDITKGYFTRFKVYPVDYYEGVRDEILPTNQCIRQFVNTIKEETLYEKICYIHDYVCNLITYPTDINPTYYHTIPCAWLDTYNHMGVCEAYAKSFAYICEIAGIEAICVTGGSKRDSAGNVLANHMWNYVKMDDGKWYLIDCTWDDQSNILKSTYLLKGSNAALYNHMPVGCFSAEVNKQYEPFTYPALAVDNYNIVRSISAPEKIILDIDEKKAASVSYLPVDANQGTEFVFEVLDKKVASVDSRGMITGKSSGVTEVIIRSKKFRNVQAGVQVQVLEHDALTDTIIVTKEPTCSEEGKTEQICKRCNRPFTTAIPIDPQAHKIGDWKVVREATCLREGKSARKCIYCGLEMDTQVIPKTPATVTLNVKSLPLQVGESTTVLAIEKKNPNDKVSAWKSSDTKIVTVNSSTGKLTGKKSGKATITLTMKSGAKATCKVTVKKKVTTKSIKGTVSSVRLKKKQSYVIKVVRTPLTATDTIAYSSSNSKIAKVSSSGKITALKAGTAKITIKTKSGARTTLKVTVK